MLPGGRRFAEHGAVAEGRELTPLEPVTISARSVIVDEAQPDEAENEVVARRLWAADG